MVVLFWAIIIRGMTRIMRIIVIWLWFHELICRYPDWIMACYRRHPYPILIARSSVISRGIYMGIKQELPQTSSFVISLQSTQVKSLRSETNSRCSANIFKSIFFNENVIIWTSILLRFISGCLINHKASLVWIMAYTELATNQYLSKWWPRSLAHICVTRP